MEASVSDTLFLPESIRKVLHHEISRLPRALQQNNLVLVVAAVVVMVVVVVVVSVLVLVVVVAAVVVVVTDRSRLAPKRSRFA